MNKKDFKNISMNGRLAYQLMCVERYLVSKYPNKDFTKLMELLWQVTNGMYWDTFSDYVMDLEPSTLFEFNTYEEQEWLRLSKEEYKELTPCMKGLDNVVDDLFETLKEQTFVYAYTEVPKNTKESIDIVFDTIKFLKQEKIKLPDVKLVEFSTIDQQDGWGNSFDGTKLSIILNS